MIRRRRPNWRSYQASLRGRADRPCPARRLCRYVVAVLFFLVIVYGVSGNPGGAANPDQLPSPSPETFSGHGTSALASSSPPQPSPFADKSEIRRLVDDKIFVNLKEKSFDVLSENGYLRVDTTLDMPLQRFISDTIVTSTARHMGIVVMDPYMGKVLSMVSFDREDPYNNPCLDSIFPAASVFKIITAAAVIERYGFGSDSLMTYFGRKHTLYKSQLKERTNRRTHDITLRDSFAQSVNPVFGKFGVHYLGRTTLEEYAEAFGFNRHIDFEIALEPSVMSVSEEPYHWAEIASGFNRETLISPLHGALIASAVMNHGRLLEPIIVERITDRGGRVLYQSHFTPLNQAVSPESSQIINEIMRATIDSGTCRKVFRKYQDDEVLSQLNMGGKTGTINNKGGNIRYDWFVGFAEEKNGPEKIVISSVIAHDKYIGKKSSRYARMIFREYFAKRLEKHSRAQRKSAKASF